MIPGGSVAARAADDRASSDAGTDREEAVGLERRWASLRPALPEEVQTASEPGSGLVLASAFRLAPPDLSSALKVRVRALK